jgi:hypothetical protein
MVVREYSGHYLINPQHYFFSTTTSSRNGLLHADSNVRRKNKRMDKKILVILWLVGMTTAYDVSVKPNLSNANQLLLNETMNTINTQTENANYTVEFLVICGFIIVLSLILAFILPILWRQIKK